MQRAIQNFVVEEEKGEKESERAEQRVCVERERKNKTSRGIKNRRRKIQVAKLVCLGPTEIDLSPTSQLA